jgi:hypothetical protein
MRNPAELRVYPDEPSVYCFVSSDEPAYWDEVGSGVYRIVGFRSDQVIGFVVTRKALPSWKELEQVVPDVRVWMSEFRWNREVEAMWHRA